MATRFRTQDTKASWARKLNALFSPSPRFREVPQTLQQWQDQLNDAVRASLTNGYRFATSIVFRMGETRQTWTRKLNLMAAGISAGAYTLAISQVMGDDAITAAEAAAVTISGTSANVANGSVVTLTATAANGTATALGTTTVTGNAWSKTAINMAALANGTYTITATSPGTKTATRTVTRTA